MAATQKEFGDARRDLTTAQNDAEVMRTADAAESRDSATSISVALQQRDAAVAAEVAAVGRAQNLQVHSCSIFPVLLIDGCLTVHMRVLARSQNSARYSRAYPSLSEQLVLKLIGSAARQGDRALLQRCSSRWFALCLRQSKYLLETIPFTSHNSTIPESNTTYGTLPASLFTVHLTSKSQHVPHQAPFNISLTEHIYHLPACFAKAF